MASIEEHILIAVSPEEVFDYRLDFAANLARYNHNVCDARQIEGHGPGVGAKYSVRVRAAPGLTVNSTLTVTEADRPRRISDSAESPVGNAQETLTFEPTSVTEAGSGTSVTFVVITEPKSAVARIAGPLLARLARRQVRLELKSMRTNLETQAGLENH